MGLGYSGGMDALGPKPGYPFPSSPEAQRRMLACGQRDTAPELAIRTVLFRMGLRYRIDLRPIPSLRRKADLVFTRLKIAVFVDGCFWHGCPQHATWPKANGEFWRQKIVGNRERDRDTDQKLTKVGWLSIRVWEHEDPDKAAARIVRIVRKRQANLTG
jgi:DNA mismatch endonuclease, patch repair protein